MVTMEQLVLKDHLVRKKRESACQRNRSECRISLVPPHALTEKVIHASTLSQNRIRRLDHTLEQFNLNPIAIGLDAGYFKAPVAESLERREILGVFGYRRPSRTKNAFKKKHFIYNKEKDSYRCPNGQGLIYKTTSRDAYREYHSEPKECAFCPMRDDCTKSKNMKKVITRHIYTEAMERANQMRLSAYGKKTYRRRSETVERSFADTKQHHGHRYARFRGLAKVQMQCWLAAAAQNIKKIALVVSTLRKLGLNRGEIAQILAYIRQFKNTSALEFIQQKISRSRPTVAHKKEPHLKKWSSSSI